MSLDRIYRQALKAYENKDFLKAKKLFLKIIKHHPDHLDAHYLLGTLFAQQGLPKKAMMHLREAIRLNPKSAMIHTNLGILHLQAKNYLLAEQSLRTALSLDINLFQTHFNLAIVLQKTNRSLESIDCLLSTIKIDPDFFPAIMLLAQIQKETGDLASAELYARKAVNIKPENIEGLHLLANILALGEKIEPTKEVYHQILELNPDDQSAAYVLNVLNEEIPDAPPRSHFESIFNDISNEFDDHLADLGYQGPSQLLSLLSLNGTTNKSFNRVLDIGCGTGAIGQLFHAHTKYLLGIDIADKMLDLCDKTGLYNELECTDIFDLDRKHIDFDLVIAADVFPYLGDINPIIKSIRARMSAGGYLLFTTERNHNSKGYTIDKLSGRYRFSDEYLSEVAHKHGFEIIQMEIEPLRKEKDEWISGHFCLWQIESTQ